MVKEMRKIVCFAFLAFFVATPATLFAKDYATYQDCTDDNGTKFCDGYFASKNKDSAKPVEETKVQPAAVTPTVEEKKETDSGWFQGYLGVNLGLSQISYATKAQQDYMPTTFGKLGFDLGLRLGKIDKDSFYNGGISMSMDELFPSETSVTVPGYHTYVSYSMYGFSFDNYLLMSPEDAMLFGIGFAESYATVEVDGPSGSSSSETASDGVNLFVMKLGWVSKISDNLDWDIMAKFMKAKNDDMMTMIDLGLRLKF
jgi:hypothetical protein